MLIVSDFGNISGTPKALKAFVQYLRLANKRFIEGGWDRDDLESQIKYILEGHMYIDSSEYYIVDEHNKLIC